MKNLRLFSVFFILAAAFNFTSCSEDIEPLGEGVGVPGPEGPGGGDGAPVVAPGTFRVNFDDGTYSTTTTTAYISGGSIFITALRSQGDSFGMMLQGTTPGTYPANSNMIGYSPVGSEFGFIGNHPTNSQADTGAIVITEIDQVNHTISGTFHFTGYWSDFDANVPAKEFTNGIFVKLPYITENPSDDTFFANVNGEEFVDTDILTMETDVEGVEYLSVAAENAAGDSITISVHPALSVGEYIITGNNATDVVQIVYTPATADFGTMALAGFVTIVEKSNDHIKCTFGGTVEIDGTTYQITQGNFDVAY